MSVFETLATKIKTLILSISKFYSRIVLNKLKPRQIQNYRKAEKSLKKTIKTKSAIITFSLWLFLVILPLQIIFPGVWVDIEAESKKYILENFAGRLGDKTSASEG